MLRVINFISQRDANCKQQSQCVKPELLDSKPICLAIVQGKRQLLASGGCFRHFSELNSNKFPWSSRVAMIL